MRSKVSCLKKQHNDKPLPPDRKFNVLTTRPPPLHLDNNQLSVVINTIKKGRLPGVSNGHKNFPSARKIWPLLDLLAKFRRVLACSCSQNFCNCSHARILVKICSIAQNFVNLATFALSKCT